MGKKNCDCKAELVLPAQDTGAADGAGWGQVFGTAAVQALITQWDATDATRIPLDPARVDTRAKAIAANVAVASYADGDFANGWIDCVHKYPVLAQLGRVTSIASRFTTTARIIDYEPGNPCYGDPDGVALWVLRMLAKKVFCPGAYADGSDMPAIEAAYIRHKVPRLETALWLAAPGKAPLPLLAQGFNLVQDAFDGQFDVSLAKPTFYPLSSPTPPAPPKPAKPTAKGKAHMFVTHDLVADTWTVRKLPGTFRKGHENVNDSAELQVNRKTGALRVAPLPHNALPLGK